MSQPASKGIPTPSLPMTPATPVTPGTLPSTTPGVQTPTPRTRMGGAAGGPPPETLDHWAAKGLRAQAPDDKSESASGQAGPAALKKPVDAKAGAPSAQASLVDDDGGCSRHAHGLTGQLCIAKDAVLGRVVYVAANQDPLVVTWDGALPPALFCERLDRMALVVAEGGQGLCAQLVSSRTPDDLRSACLQTSLALRVATGSLPRKLHVIAAGEFTAPHSVHAVAVKKQVQDSPLAWVAGNRDEPEAGLEVVRFGGVRAFFVADSAGRVSSRGGD